MTDEKFFSETDSIPITTYDEIKERIKKGNGMEWFTIAMDHTKGDDFTAVVTAVKHPDGRIDIIDSTTIECAPDVESFDSTESRNLPSEWYKKHATGCHTATALRYALSALNPPRIFKDDNPKPVFHPVRSIAEKYFGRWGPDYPKVGTDDD